MQSFDIEHAQHYFRIVVTGVGENCPYPMEPNVSKKPQSELMQLIRDYQRKEYVPPVEQSIHSMPNQNKAQSLDNPVRQSKINNVNKVKIPSKVPKTIEDIIDMDLLFLDDIVIEQNQRQSEETNLYISSSLR